MSGTFMGSIGFAGSASAATTKYCEPEPGCIVRSGPSTSKSKVGDTLKQGKQVTVAKTQNGWSQISSPRAGWIRSDLLTGTKPNASLAKTGAWAGVDLCTRETLKSMGYKSAKDRMADQKKHKNDPHWEEIDSEVYWDHYYLFVTPKNPQCG